MRAIAAALTRAVLTWRHGEVYAFTQALVREVLYDSLGVIRRAALHEAAAEALAGFRHQVGERGPTVAEFAHHLVAAAMLGGGQRLDLAITYATAAGTAATVAGDHHDACAHHETALGLAVRAQWPPGPLGRLTVALGRAALAAGACAKGRTALRAAARQARQAGDAELLAEAALGHGPRAAVGLTAPSAELIGLLTEAREGDLPAVPPDPGRLTVGSAPLRPLAARDHTVRVTARLAVELADGPDRASAARLVAPAEAAPETFGPRPLAEFLVARAIVAREPADARSAVRAALDLGDPLLVCQARLSLGAAALAAADLGAARDELERVAKTAPAVRHPLASWWGACATPGAHAGRPEPRWVTARLAPGAVRPGRARPGQPRDGRRGRRGNGRRRRPVDGGAAGRRRLALLRARLRLARHDPATAGQLLRAVEPSLAGTVWQPVAQQTRAELRLAAGHADAKAPSGRVDGLTPREQEVLNLALAGTSAREIATLLFISERTAESHLANIYRKLNVRSRVELLAWRLG